MEPHNIMENKTSNSSVFLLLTTALSVAHVATRILVSRYTNYIFLLFNVVSKYPLPVFLKIECTLFLRELSAISSARTLSFTKGFHGNMKIHFSLCPGR